MNQRPQSFPQSFFPFQEQLILSRLYLRASSTSKERETLVEAWTATDGGEWTPWPNVLLVADARVPFYVRIEVVHSFQDA
jgi:hypothetical protein